MPTVPYTGVPEISPQGGNTPYGHIDTPGAAFGTTIAQEASKAGDMLAKHAIQFQQIQLETMSREAELHAMTEAASARAQFHNLQGADAQKGLEDYYKGLQDIREKWRGTLPPIAGKMFDSTFTRYMGYEINSGATHAAQQNKVWRTQTADAGITLAQNEAAANSGDDIAFKHSVDDISDRINVKARELGWDDTKKTLEFGKDRSGAWERRLEDMAKTNPSRARRLFEDNKQDILGDTQQKIDAHIRAQEHSVGSRVISDAVNQGWGAHMQPQDIARARGVEPALIETLKETQRAHPEWDIRIAPQGGVRNIEEQREIVARGASKTMDSNHLTGRAMDVVFYQNGRMDDALTQKMQGQLRQAMQASAEKTGAVLGKPISWDPDHYELPRDYDTSKFKYAPRENETAKVARAQAEAERQRPDDPIYADVTRQRTMADHYHQERMAKDVERQRQGTIDDWIYSDKPPRSVDELHNASPEVQQAWADLSSKDRAKAMKEIATIAKGATRMDESGYRRLDELRGQAVTDPQGFLDQKIWDEDRLNMQAKMSLRQLQRSTEKKAEDVHLRSALTDLKDLMDEQEITPKNPEQHNQFVGALQRTLEDFQNQNKRPPKYDEVIAMGTRLMRDNARHFMGYQVPLTADTPLFQQEMPEADIEKVRQHYKDQGMSVPSDAEINREYVRQRYQELYGPKAKKEPSGGGSP